LPFFQFGQHAQNQHLQSMLAREWFVWSSI